jgi:hypothetical protein
MNNSNPSQFSEALSIIAILSGMAALAWWLASAFGRLGGMDREATRLKRHQAKIRQGKRDNDDFLVS